ncbi:hypothetical protein NE237_014141 [Protea cynaroides]|uniref:Uncharacterized protein n=1 Tax=Protea cynaroides TaxID=273540 RepID=A0A9Q0H0M3_9MAGN|nr:hypothetical protein NE237_014141 [Protea cynaroides]
MCIRALALDLAVHPDSAAGCRLQRPRLIDRHLDEAPAGPLRVPELTGTWSLLYYLPVALELNIVFSVPILEVGMFDVTRRVGGATRVPQERHASPPATSILEGTIGMDLTTDDSVLEDKVGWEWVLALHLPWDVDRLTDLEEEEFKKEFFRFATRSKAALVTLGKATQSMYDCAWVAEAKARQVEAEMEKL